MPNGNAPLLLQRVLDSYNLKQAELVRFLSTQGQQMSKTSLSRLVKTGQWPKRIDTDVVKKLTCKFLTTHKVPEHLLTDIWRNATPQTALTQCHESTEEEEMEMLSPAAMSYFKLSTNPFENEIHALSDVYLSSDYRRHLQQLHACARSGSMACLISECGGAKSTLRRVFSHQITEQDPDLIVIEPARIDRKKITAESLSQAICRALQVKTGGMSGEERDAAMTDALITSSNNGHRHLLMIDEAHDLTIPVLKLLKRIWELTAGFTHLMGIVLFGQPELKRAMAGDRVREFSWRCQMIEIQALNRQQVVEYTQFKFERMGMNALDIFTEEALHLIHNKCLTRLSIGINQDGIAERSYPLAINAWLTKALNYAAAINEPKIDERTVLEL